MKYDEYYQEENHFGEPYPELIRFFEEFDKRGKVLDLGCGQGRDALVLARLGYEVTAIDISQVGIAQMNEVAEKEGLSVKGIVGDIYEFHLESHFDFVLLDSILHFYKREREKEIGFLNRIMDEMENNSYLCVLVSKSKTTEPILQRQFEKKTSEWNVIADKYIEYPKTKSLFRMLVAKKG